nr:putative ribonuclease h protein [Quercus suber]
MYANDIVLFTKATIRNALTLVECIDKYCKWSSQCLNRAKSRVFFSKHTPLQSQRSIKHILEMKKLKQDVVYLGAPLFLSKTPSKDFKYLADRLETKLTGWRSKTLSRAGRTTLIKSVAQAIPNYAMSSLNIPSGVCNKLDALSCRFWWKPKSQYGPFLALTAWDNLYKPTCKGGLGFRKAKDFNNALLAKLAWMIASKSDSLCMAILRAKYKVCHSWLRDDAPSKASPVWRAKKK